MVLEDVGWRFKTLIPAEMMMVMIYGACCFCWETYVVTNSGACEELKELLRSTCKELAKACPSVVQVGGAHAFGVRCS